MSPVLIQLADASSGPAALGLNGQAFLIQLITFLIVFLVLRQWAFKPILKMLNRRHDLIEEGVTLGEKMRAERTALEASVADRLHSARKQADALLADAETEARQKVAKAEETARTRAADVLKEANEQLKSAADRERKRLEKEVVELVSDVSEAVIREKVDARKDAALIDKALREHARA